MNQYRKLIVALVGVGLMLLKEQVGLDLSAQEVAISDMIIAALTAAGVYAVPNKTPES